MLINGDRVQHLDRRDWGDELQVVGGSALAGENIAGINAMAIAAVKHVAHPPRRVLFGRQRSAFH